MGATAKGFATLFGRMLKPGALEEYNSLVRKSTRKADIGVEELNSMLDVLDTKHRLISKPPLSYFTQPIQREPGQLLRLQDGVFNPGEYGRWGSTHFDATGGRQLPDILKMLRPDDPRLVEAVLDPSAKGAVARDFEINSPRLELWKKELGVGTLKGNDHAKLADALRSNGIDFLVYPNTYEGNMRSEAMRSPVSFEPRTQTLEELIQEIVNPSVAVTNQKMLDFTNLGYAKGGLAQYKDKVK